MHTLYFLNTMAGIRTVGVERQNSENQAKEYGEILEGGEGRPCEDEGAVSSAWN